MMWRPWRCIFLLGAVIAAIGPVGAVDPSAPIYHVVQIKKKLFREEPAPETLLNEGARLEAGTLLRTGSGSWAEIECREAGARFRLAAKTRARLAPGAPGLLLELERGRLRALFEKVLGDQSTERRVTTPTAVLAVRGTEYGVEVDAKGRTMVTVFVGEVQVRDRAGAFDPVTVGRGQYLRVRRDRPIGPAQSHRMSSEDWDRGGRPNDRPSGDVSGQPQRGTGSGGEDPRGGMGSGSSSGSGSGGSHGGGGRG